MIPKVVYLIWLKKDIDAIVPKDTLIFMQNTMAWSAYNGYLYVCISNNSPIFEECIGLSKFCSTQWNNRGYGYLAAVSDYLRLYILNKYGGIYLDTDVKIHKWFYPFMDSDYFIGYEPFENGNTKFNRFDVGTIGSTQNNSVLQKLMYIMDNYLCDCYLESKYTVQDGGFIYLKIKENIPIDNRYYNNSMWLALPDLFPFVINVMLGKEIVINDSPRIALFQDLNFLVYNKNFFSSGGLFTEHCFHTKWL